jgi:hypothetical protein
VDGILEEADARGRGEGRVAAAMAGRGGAGRAGRESCAFERGEGASGSHRVGGGVEIPSIEGMERDF